MLRHQLGELQTAHVLEAGVIIDQLRVEKLPAGHTTLEEHRAQLGPPGVETGG